MPIHRLCPILIHHFLLLPALKCLYMDQFCKDKSQNCFVICSRVYLPMVYSYQVSRPLEGVYSTCLLLYMPFIYVCWEYILDTLFYNR